MLGTLQEKEKTKWRNYVKPLIHAYNCMRSEVIGFSPYELIFGWQPRLPINIAFGLPLKEGSPIPHSQYVKEKPEVFPEGKLPTSYHKCKESG